MVERRLACAISCALLASACNAGVIYVEQTQGDLSNDRFAPKAFNLSPGSNELFGILSGEDPQGNIDRDYFSITIPQGFELSAMSLTGYDSTDFAAFAGIQPGAVFPDDPATVQPGDLMGWTLFGQAEVFKDMLPLMGVNGQGFSAPLPAGTYSFWFQQIGAYTEYSLDFVVTVPSPSVVGLASALTAACGFRRRR